MQRGTFITLMDNYKNLKILQTSPILWQVRSNSKILDPLDKYSVYCICTCKRYRSLQCRHSLPAS